MTTDDLRQTIALYESPDHTVQLDVRVDADTVWLTQQQMAQLFGRDVTTIRKHIANAREEELLGLSTSAKFALVRIEGKRKVTRDVEHYNLDMVLSVGYRVKSREGVFFRRWANGVLRQHVIEGYTINRKRLEALRTTVRILERADAPEVAGAAQIIQRYLPSLGLLADYDANTLDTPQGTPPSCRLTYEEAMGVVRDLPFYASSETFGRERSHALEGIVNGLYQGFADQDLYPTAQQKAANLLYQVVKDHPFMDGNKRSAAALFVHFLDMNGLLRRGDQLLVEGNALAAMTLMIALSDPREKDAMVALVENFIA